MSLGRSSAVCRASEILKSKKENMLAHNSTLNAAPATTAHINCGLPPIEAVTRAGKHN